MTHLDSILPLGEVGELLLCLKSLPCRLVLGQPPPDGTGSLGAEIERKVLLALVEDAELLALGSVDDSQDTGNRLADIMAVIVGLVRLALRRLLNTRGAARSRKSIHLGELR